MTASRLHPDSPWLLALLAALVALGPLSIDMYLPALPAMMVVLDTNISQMHLTLSAYLTGFAVFHLVCGPLADRFGRKPILIIGTLIFVAASIACSLSTTVEELLAYRFIQGIGACVGPTLARTITRDIFGPTRAAKALSLIAMLMALAPAVAPSLGAGLLLFFPWSSIFVFLAVYGVAIIALIQLYLPESLPQQQSLHPLAIAGNFGELLRHPYFLVTTVTSSLVYAAMMAYLSSSSFVYIEMLGVPVKYFGLIFLTSVFGYICGSAVSARLSTVIASERIMLGGNLLAVLSTLAMWAGNALYPSSVLALMLPMIVFTAALGLVLPHAMAIALAPFPHIAGTASSLQGFIQMSLSASTAAAAGLFLKDSPQPMTIAMVVITLSALGLNLWLGKRPPQSQH